MRLIQQVILGSTHMYTGVVFPSAPHGGRPDHKVGGGEGAATRVECQQVSGFLCRRRPTSRGSLGILPLSPTTSRHAARCQTPIKRRSRVLLPILRAHRPGRPIYNPIGDGVIVVDGSGGKGAGLGRDYCPPDAMRSGWYQWLPITHSALLTKL